MPVLSKGQIAFQGAIAVDAATQFFTMLFRQLRVHVSVESAMNAARAMLRGHVDWWRPILLLGNAIDDYRSDDERKRDLVTWLQRQGLGGAFLQDDLLSHILRCPALSQVKWEEYPDLVALLHALWDLGGESRELVDLLQLARITFGWDIDFASAYSLRTLLRGVALPIDDLPRLYYRSLPSGVRRSQLPQFETTFSFLSTIIDRLLSETTHGGRHPLVCFAEEMFISHKSLFQERGLEEKMRAWLEKHGSTLLSRETSATSSAKMDMTLQVLVRPVRDAQPSDRRYDIDGWLMVTQSAMQPYHRPLTRIERQQLSDLDSSICSILEEGQDNLPDAAIELTVEIFLPIELLALPVDQLLIQGALGNEIPLGKACRTVVRSVERVLPRYRQRLAPAWRRKWANYQHVVDQDLTQHVHWIDCEAAGRVQNLQGILYREHIIGVIQTWLPVERTVQSATAQVLESGLPVALLVRPGSHTPDLARQILGTLLTDCGVRELCKRVFDHRLSDDSETHLGCYLTLLWDNPDRLPPLAA